MGSSLDEVPKFDMAVEEGSITSSTIGQESVFSEENPLTKGDAASLEKTASKKPQAMALHGWQRTVAVDEDFAPTIQVCLGAPGTGLMKPPLRHQDSAASCGQLDINPQDLGRLIVTREDKKEAKSLRALPVAPGAAPLPFPRVVSEADESSLTESLHSSISLSATTPAKRYGRQEHSGESPTSTTSSDLNFLVKTSGTSGFFGTRPSFGRSVEPRIPATVGEERLHNSLAKFFTEVRRDVAVSLPINNEVGESGGESYRSSDSQDKEMSGKSGTVTSTPVTKPETRESSLSDFSAKLAPSSLSDVKLKLDADSRSSRQQEAKREDPVYVSTDDDLKEKRNTQVESTLAEKTATRQSLKESASMEQRMDGVREGAEASRSVSKCGCFSFSFAWPWKLLAGAMMLVTVVAVVTVVTCECTASSEGQEGRRLDTLAGQNGTINTITRSHIRGLSLSAGIRENFTHLGSQGANIGGGEPDSVSDGPSNSERRRSPEFPAAQRRLDRPT